MLDNTYNYFGILPSFIETGMHIQGGGSKFGRTFDFLVENIQILGKRNALD